MHGGFNLNTICPIINLTKRSHAVILTVMTECVERALCLFKRKVGEKDIEVGAFSREKGILYIKIISSLKGSKLDYPLCSTSSVYLAPRSSEKHYILKDIKIEKLRDEIVSNYDLFYYYSFALNVLMYFGKYDFAGSYDLFESFLELLIKGTSPLLLLSHSIEKFFLLQGISGEYEACPECGKEYDNEEMLGYSFENNYVCCAKCADKINVLSSNMRRYLASLQTIALKDAVRYTDIDEKRLFMYECFRLKALRGAGVMGIDEILSKIK